MMQEAQSVTLKLLVGRTPRDPRFGFEIIVKLQSMVTPTSSEAMNL